MCIRDRSTTLRPTGSRWDATACSCPTTLRIPPPKSSKHPSNSYGKTSGTPSGVAAPRRRSSPRPMGRLRPVSYTHLDVYKRQSHGSVLRTPEDPTTDDEPAPPPEAVASEACEPRRRRLRMPDYEQTFLCVSDVQRRAGIYASEETKRKLLDLPMCICGCE